MYAQLGSISHATMRTEDLIPSFMDALDDIKDDLATSGKDDQWTKDAITRIDNVLADIEQRRAKFGLDDTTPTDDVDDAESRWADYYDSADADYDLNETLFDLLNEFAPPYAYFGAHPGDGSDYGFWLSEDVQQDVKDNGGLVVEDTSEVPEDYRGEVLHINDHGNATLYYTTESGELVEVWSVV